MTRIVSAVATAWLAVAATAAAQNAAPKPTGSDAEARELYSRIIAFETSIAGRQVPAMAEYLAGLFRAAGIPDEDITILPLMGTASLVVRYRGDGTGGRPILLMAHMDVVTAKREDWQRDPFTLAEENGYFFGRGTSDNKEGVAAITTAVLRLKASGFVPTRDLLIYFSGDEETSQVTTIDTARNHRELIDAEFALNSDGGGGTLSEGSGQPIVYEIQTAEKTYADFAITTRNPGGHSSQPRKDNAIYALADALVKLQGFRFPVMWNDTTLASLAAAGQSTSGELGAAMRAFANNPADTAAADVLAANPSYIGVTRTTCVATMLQGGHAENALPQSATANVNCRIFPGVPVETVHRTLQDLFGGEVEVKLSNEPHFSDASPLRDDVFAAVTRAVHARHPGVKIVPGQSSGATDGAVFRGIGIPTYGVGAIFIKDSDSFAHGLNERVPVQSFYDGIDQWEALLRDLAGPKQ
jgi:acetylornithine deacetylase/succinyl-diaminopimelate desuccinylase-like protein